jgi:hypothetical protein
MHQVKKLRAGVAAISYHVAISERLTIQCFLQLGSTFDLRFRELRDRQHPTVNIYCGIGCKRTSNDRHGNLQYALAGRIPQTTAVLR